MVKLFLPVKISSYLCSYFWGGSSESAPMFWNALFEGAIIPIFWFMDADMVAVLCFHGYLVLINMLLNVEHL